MTIDIIRRDTLAASELIKSPLQRLTERYQLEPGPTPGLRRKSGSPLPDTHTAAPGHHARGLPSRLPLEGGNP